MQCDDGTDNDDNGLIDMQDPNCANPSDNRERQILGTRRCGLGFEPVGLLLGVRWLVRRSPREA